MSMAVGLSASLSPGSTCLQREGLAGGCSWFLRVSRASTLGFFKVVSLLPGFGDLTTRCLVVCACKCAFRVHGPPWVCCRGLYQPGSFPLTSSRAASAPPPLGRVWFRVFENLSQCSLKRFSFAVIIFHPGRVPRWSWAVSSSLASSTVLCVGSAQRALPSRTVAEAWNPLQGLLGTS